MMKKLLILSFIFISLEGLFAQTDCRSTCTSNGTTIRAYIKPFEAQVSWPNNTSIQLLVIFSLPANGATDVSMAPMPTSVTTTLGSGSPVLTTLFVANDRYNYAYQYLTNSSPSTTWAVNSENLVMSLTFTSEVDGIFPRLDNLLNSGSGPGNANYFYFEINSVQRSDTEGDPFYNGVEGSYPSTDQYVEAISPLPINLLSFDAEKNRDRNVLLNWNTASETNSSHFEVQRSFDNLSWIIVGKVEAAGNSNLIETYTLLDENVYNGEDRKLTAHYRLKLVDIDGSFIFSSIQSVTFGNTIATGKDFLVYPNPASDGVQVEWDASAVAQPTSIEFYDITGKLIHTTVVSDQTNQQYVDFRPTGIYSGLYLMRIMSGDEAIEHKQIVVGRSQ